jgi:hypothetical protein
LRINSVFKYRNKPFNGKISIDRIREIVKSKAVYVGFKSATARKELLLKYDNNEKTYIRRKLKSGFYSFAFALIHYKARDCWIFGFS